MIFRFKKENCINISGTLEEQEIIDMMYDINDIIYLSITCKIFEEILNSNEEHFLYSKEEAKKELKNLLSQLSNRVSQYNELKRKTKGVCKIILEGSTLVNVTHNLR